MSSTATVRSAVPAPPATATAHARMQRLPQALLSIARSRVGSLVLLALIPVLLRLAVLPRMPYAAPAIHDEFSYLLAADTFASGRLANPVHPLWRSFETFHVLQRPAYVSKYPPGQGLLLAAGKTIFQQPLIAVWLSAGVLCAAIGWMLRAWVSLPWAFLGGVLATLHVYPGHYWMDSYWGGTLTAIGGALSIGAAQRIAKGGWVSGAVLGVGLSMLLLTRPYEGGVLGLLLSSYLLLRFLKSETKAAFLRRVAAAAAVLAGTAGFFGYYNWRITGKPLRLPYMLYEQQYQPNLPLYLWAPFGPPAQVANQPMQAYALSQEKAIEQYRNWKQVGKRWLLVLGFGFQKMGWLRAVVILLFVPGLLRQRNMGLPLLALAVFSIALCLPSYYYEHYSAPLAAVWILIYVQCLRRVCLAGRRFLSIPKFYYLTWSGALAGLLGLLLLTTAGQVRPSAKQTGPAVERERIAVQLNQLPGDQLVLVRYRPDHDFGFEWVYNAASIDQSKVVWARELNPAQDAAVLQYFAGRKTWLLEADAPDPKLQPYSVPTAAQEIAIQGR